MLVGNVLITGGSGFLGRGIMRRAARDGWPAKFFVLSRDEKKQWEARQKFPDTKFILGDVTDYHRLVNVFSGMDYVVHAAALKYIPEGELNADECVRVNIDGARVVRDAAVAAGVPRVVGISTDKAAQPVNVYGMTKAVMERLFAEAATTDVTKFTTCRYGNVIGSTGSVVPVMRQQFRETGYVNITDPCMTRFWMSVDEAVDVILSALVALPGTIVVPNPRAATMADVATAVLRVEGADFGQRGNVQIIGKRPGEKQHEDLISHYELFRTQLFGEKHYLILPPGSEDYSNDRPTLSSDQAEHIGIAELSDMIRDAGGV